MFVCPFPDGISAHVVRSCCTPYRSGSSSPRSTRRCTLSTTRSLFGPVCLPEEPMQGAIRITIRKSFDFHTYFTLVMAPRPN